jgi:ferredoxin--NADP+ reductase
MCEDFVGKRHLQDLVRSGSIEHETGVPLDPAAAHVFLCGSPAMIGVPYAMHHGQPTVSPGSMLDVLHGRGFRTELPDRPGNVHFERYW